ncbi:MAG: ribose-phosphate pyrophosphokinase [Lachnospiraceae bacterium]|nr:ribose-phosphate pyrophosphokinase [Lachnospiraceae bacterium]
MIRLNEKRIEVNHFPDGTLLLKENPGNQNKEDEMIIQWNYENNEELLAVYFLTKHLKEAGFQNIVLKMPYIPNARQDRVKKAEDVFTLKYFAELINSLSFKRVEILDAHSNVSLALIDHVKLLSPKPYIDKVIDQIGTDLVLFCPDEGAKKRYSEMVDLPCCFGIKNRDFSTGKIIGLDVWGDTKKLMGKDVLIIDDICSYGGTFLSSAKKLKEMGANEINLFVTHLEKSVWNGELLKTDYIKKIYTTDSIYQKEDENDRIEVITEL